MRNCGPVSTFVSLRAYSAPVSMDSVTKTYQSLFYQTTTVFSDITLIENLPSETFHFKETATAVGFFSSAYFGNKTLQQSKMKLDFLSYPKFNFCSVLYIYLIMNLSVEFPRVFKNKLESTNCHDKYQASCDLICRPKNNWHLFVLISHSNSTMQDLPTISPNTFIPTNAFAFSQEQNEVYFLKRFRWKYFQLKKTHGLNIVTDLLWIQKEIRRLNANLDSEKVYMISTYPPTQELFTEERRRHLTRKEMSAVAGTLVCYAVVRKMNGTFISPWKGPRSFSDPSWWVKGIRVNLLSLGSPTGSTLERRQELEYSTLFDVSYILFVVGLPQKSNRTFWFLLQPFKKLVWLCLILTFVLVTIFTNYLLPRSPNSQLLQIIKDTCSLAIKLFAFLFDQSVPMQPIVSKIKRSVNRIHDVRVLIGGWALGCFVLSNLYRSSIVSFLIRPEMEPVPVTFEMLAESSFEVQVMRNMQPSVETAITSILTKQLNKTARRTTGNGFLFRRQTSNQCFVEITKTSSVCVTYDITVNIVARQFLTSETGNEMFVLSKDRILPILNGVPLNPYAGMKESADFVIGSLMSGGIIPKWLEISASFSSTEGWRRAKVRCKSRVSKDSQLIQKSSSSLSANGSQESYGCRDTESSAGISANIVYPIYVCLLGMCISLLTLTLEWLYYVAMKLGRNCIV